MIAYLKPTGKGGTGSRLSPLSVGDLAEVWTGLPDRVCLLWGEYYTSGELAPKESIQGWSMDETTIVSGGGLGVIRGRKDYAHVADLTVQCNSTGPVCNGVYITGDYLVIERIKVIGLWSDKKQPSENEPSPSGNEAFGILPVGSNSVVRGCIVEGITSQYAAGICPVGTNITVQRCMVEGTGVGRLVAYGIYNSGGTFEANRFSGVHFGFYGDRGGSGPEADGRSWDHIEIVGNVGKASEAAFRIQSIRQTYSDILIGGNMFEAPSWVSVMQFVDGQLVHEPFTRGLHLIGNDLRGGPGFGMDTVPGCTVVNNVFEVAPVRHKFQLPIHWVDNSHLFVDKEQ